MTNQTRKVALAAAAVLAAAGAVATSAATVQAQSQKPAVDGSVRAVPPDCPNKWTDPEV